MSEFRKNMLTNEWVIIAGNRSNRPYDFVKNNTTKVEKKDCNFCPGNEHNTPETLFEIKRDGIWVVRVFNNKYPAVHSYNFENFGDNNEEDVLFSDGFGLHEVLVDTNKHDELIHDFKKSHMIDLLYALKNRHDFMSSKDELKYIQIFKNQGVEAGASISHSHWQIVGLPIIPTEIENIYNNFNIFKKSTNNCLMCGIIENEQKFKERVVFESEHFIVFVPYAPKTSYEVMIVPKKHISSFASFEEILIEDFSICLKKLLNSVKMLRENICYNICFMDSIKNDEDFHFYVKIIPRLGNAAGFEFATNMYINQVLPEIAAKRYRENLKE